MCDLEKEDEIVGKKRKLEDVELLEKKDFNDGSFAQKRKVVNDNDKGNETEEDIDGKIEVKKELVCEGKVKETLDTDNLCQELTVEERESGISEKQLSEAVKGTETGLAEEESQKTNHDPSKNLDKAQSQKKETESSSGIEPSEKIKIKATECGNRSSVKESDNECSKYLDAAESQKNEIEFEGGKEHEENRKEISSSSEPSRKIETEVTECGNESSTKDLEDKDEENKKDLERKHLASVQTFQQLSGVQNAFSGVHGTGFSSSSFTFDTKITSGFGSTPKFGSFDSGSAFPSPTFTGILNGKGSFFGTTKENQESHRTSSGGTTISGVSPILFFESPSAKGISTSEIESGTFKEVPVETGEENEKTLFTADAVLFQFRNGAWKERGKGELKVNVSSEDTRRPRLVMRTKGHFKLILNASIYPEMKLTCMDDRGFSFACLNSADECEEGFRTFALKFKDSCIAGQFKVTLEDQRERQIAESEP
eukprot:TRINITY_DN6481_c0_g1_i1.p1 TRINITY_DN6481_c0_g1~~TRINITY_DN6481_c0_g1_i1.p1  ORF type:complete len:483 (+),score=133.77 TRINITY_DN6481_c0_g1_i1:284-1732(+)